MTKKLFKMANNLIASLGLAVLCLATIPSIAIADSNPCNKWGAKCHVEHINTIHTQDDTVNSGLLDTIKNAINWVLGILATVALCICLYGGLKMITSGADGKGYKDGRTILKNAAIGLAIILLAWMIVSVVFWFVATLSQGNQTQSENLKPIGG